VRSCKAALTTKSATQLQSSYLADICRPRRGTRTSSWWPWIVWDLSGTLPGRRRRRQRGRRRCMKNKILVVRLSHFETNLCSYRYCPSDLQLVTTMLRFMTNDRVRGSLKARGWSEKLTASTIDGNNIGKIFFS